MKPRKYPYSGKLKLVRKELPSETIINCEIPEFLSYEEKKMRMRLIMLKIVEALNRYRGGSK